MILFPELIVSEFDDLELHSLKYDRQHKCYYIIDDGQKPDMYGIYIHIKSGGIECIAECKNKAEAEILYDFLDNICKKHIP